MISPEQVPDEVVEAAAKSMGWTSAIALSQDKLRFKGHIAAAINAWPGAQKDRVFLGVLLDGHDNRITRLCLPLPKDAAGA